MRRVAALLVICAACNGSTRFALMPGIRQSSRDPNPTRPLVEQPPPRPENGKASRPVGVVGRFDAALSGASILARVLGAGGLLVGAYGEFDESSWFGKQPRSGRHEQGRDAGEGPAPEGAAPPPAARD